MALVVNKVLMVLTVQCQLVLLSGRALLVLLHLHILHIFIRAGLLASLCRRFFHLDAQSDLVTRVNQKLA